MAELSIRHDSIPLWSGGAGAFVVDTRLLDPSKPLDPAPELVLNASFQAKERIKLGRPGSLSLVFDAGRRVRIIPLWKEFAEGWKEVVDQYDLGGCLRDDNLMMLFQLGSSLSAGLPGSFKYSVLTAETELEAGTDSDWTVVRSFRRDVPLYRMLQELVAGFALPEDILVPPRRGDVTAIEYGGYIRLGASVSTGCRIAGSLSTGAGDICLSESCGLQLQGSLGVKARLAGRFSIEVREAAGIDREGWARVIVRRRRSNEFKAAADAGVEVSLRSNAEKVITSALAGVGILNWLNLARSVAAHADSIEDLRSFLLQVDDLAREFFGEWIGKGIEELTARDCSEAAGRVRAVAESCGSFDGQVISVFERYDGDSGALTALKRLAALASLESISHETDVTLEIIDMLAGGRNALAETESGGIDDILKRIRERAAQVIELMEANAHREIRSFIRLAGEKFGLDMFMDGIDAVDNVEMLRQAAAGRIGHFISRLVGRRIKDTDNLKDILAIIREVRERRKQFEDRVSAVFKETASQSMAFKLSAEYSRSSESDALVDAAINLSHPDGLRLMKEAGRGNFEELLERYNPDLVRLYSGKLTHAIADERLFKVNIAGWHFKWNYEGFYRVMVESEQRILPGINGTLTIQSRIDLETSSGSSRNSGTRREEKMQCDFLLRFLAESRGILDGSGFDEETRQYVIDTITGRAAVYKLICEDRKTSEEELRQYLGYAREFGLDRAGATFEQVAPMLERIDGGFGAVEARYEVRFSETGLKALLDAPFDPHEVRQILRRIVLANYRNQPSLGDVAWCYCSDAAREKWKSDPNAWKGKDNLMFSGFVSPVAGTVPPERVTLRKAGLVTLSTLFDIEESMIRGLGDLWSMLGKKGGTIPVREFESRLSALGRALRLFDEYDEGDNTIFAVFDGLIQRSSCEAGARSSLLKLTTESGGARRTRIFAL